MMNDQIARSLDGNATLLRPGMTLEQDNLPDSRLETEVGRNGRADRPDRFFIKLVAWASLVRLSNGSLWPVGKLSFQGRRPLANARDLAAERFNRLSELCDFGVVRARRH